MPSEILHFNLIRTELDCSPVLFGHKKSVASTICLLLEPKVVVMQNYFTFFFPPSFFLVLSRSSGWFWQKAVDGPWSTAWVLNALPNCLLWIRFSLSWAGIQLQDGCFPVLFIGLLHRELCSALTESRWLVERKKKHPTKPKNTYLYFFSFTVYRFLWHTDCSWMCKKTGLEVSMES